MSTSLALSLPPSLPLSLSLPPSSLQHDQASVDVLRAVRGLRHQQAHREEGAGPPRGAPQQPRAQRRERL